jgi:hypothetical protein
MNLRSSFLKLSLSLPSLRSSVVVVAAETDSVIGT